MQASNTINLWRPDSGQIPRNEGLYLGNLGTLIILLDLHQVYIMFIGWTAKKTSSFLFHVADKNYTDCQIL